MFGTSPKVKRELSNVQRRYRTLRVPGCFVSYTTKGVTLRPNADALDIPQTQPQNTGNRWA
jgi:hypothetical protein